MDTIANSGNRPIHIKIASSLLAVSLGLGIVKMTVGSHLNYPPTYFVITIVVALSFLEVWLIYRGKNWARWFFAVVFVLGLLLTPRSIQRLYEKSMFDVLFYGLQLLLQLATVALLFVGPSNRWFVEMRRKKTE